MKYYLFLHKICKNILFFLFFCKTNREINKKQIAQSHNRATKYHLVIIHSLKAKSMLSAFLHHDTLFAEMVEPLLSHVWSQAEVDVNVVFQFHISCCLMVRCFLYSLSSMKDDANIYNNVITCIFWCKLLGLFKHWYMSCDYTAFVIRPYDKCRIIA